MNRKRNAFALIELLIVVAIVGILAAIGVPIHNGFFWICLGERG